MLAAVRLGGAERVEFTWPTPNPAWNEGKPAASFLQQAGSGDPESGGFGGVRSAGTQFHEGIDIVPQARDRRGEPADDIFAAMAGVVRHINSSAGDSSYGRYIVIEHPDQTPGIYTLYAHLARIAPGLRAGERVTRGQVIGTMGHSSGGYSIPRDRSHLHFEMGVMVTRDFQTWYGRQKFGSVNEQGLWNGKNLMGFDPLDFLNQWRAKRVNTFQEYFAQMEPVVTLRIATIRTPDFVLRYPSLVTKELPLGPVAGWEIKCNWTGIPVGWTPLTANEVIGLARDQARIVAVNSEIERRQRSKSLAVSRRGSWTVGKDLGTVLQQLFGVK
ncbi:MAG: M23 family metallopeptidase [Undibacterium sp.]|nr:M23 family metallopeptidase [Opitutaceae bacterium]